MATPPTGGGFFSGIGSTLGTMASAAGSVGGALVSGGAGMVEANSFVGGMTALQQQTNVIQLAMGRLNFEKVCVEGYAKFLKEMGKGFVQQ